MLIMQNIKMFLSIIHTLKMHVEYHEIPLHFKIALVKMKKPFKLEKKIRLRSVHTK